MDTHPELSVGAPRLGKAVPVQLEAGARPPRGGAPAGWPAWRRRYPLLVAASDLTVIAVSVTVFIVIGLGGSAAADRARLASGLVAAGLLAVTLPLCRAWEAWILGQGTAEFARLGRAIVMACVLLALAGLLMMVDSVRIWVFVLMPATGLLCLASRYLLRKWLHRLRSRGRCLMAVLAVGGEEAVADLVRRTRRDQFFGWSVTAACTPTGTGPDGADTIEGVPIVGDLDDVAGIIIRQGAHEVVAVCPAPGFGPRRLHRLAWQLEDTDAELAVDPGLMEIAGPRMHIAPVDGLPLLRLSRPRFSGLARVTKTVIDRVVATLLLLIVAPVFIVIILAIRLSDRGPAFFTQERIGSNGRAFQMIKFRSMCVDAETRLDDLRPANDGAGPMFKLHADPRVTRVGRILRRYSLDELPQLINVLKGTMSLVGPRPPLPREVATYADDARRRLLVRPGMTGLWQVSGRSVLSWEESVRLDLRYVENWSLALDLVILWKTFGAVFEGRGAY